jgi:hypothetical protein
MEFFWKIGLCGEVCSVRMPSRVLAMLLKSCGQVHCRNELSMIF